MKWLPDVGAPKAVLQLAHGIAEHMGRYDSFARFMAENGYAVVGNNHLGHGQPAAGGRDRGFFTDRNGWDTAVADMHKLYETTRAEYPALPYFILGHSMGSFMLQTFLISYREQLSGCVLSGSGQQSQPLLGFGIALASLQKRLFGARKQSPGLQRMSFGTYNRRIPGCRTPYDWISRDSAVVDSYIADEDSGYVPTIGLYCDMFGGIGFNGRKRNVARMRRDIPILLASGTEDPVGEYGKGPRKIHRLFKEAGITDVTLKFYDGARHEILNETNREEVYADILAWMNTKI